MSKGPSNKIRLTMWLISGDTCFQISELATSCSRNSSLNSKIEFIRRGWKYFSVVVC